MGFWRKAFGLPEREVKKRDTYSISDPALVQYFGLTTYTGETVNECTGLNVSAAYRGLDLTAGSISTLPLHAIETDKQGRKYEKSSWLDNPYGPPDDPDFYQGTQEQWKQTVSAHYVLYNEVFLWLFKNKAGQVHGALPIHPSLVSVEVDDDAPGKRTYSVMLEDGTQEKRGTDKVHHILGLTTDGIRGIHVITKMRQSLGIALAGERSAGTVMKNGPQHTVLITSPNEDFTEAEAATIQESVQGAIGGAENAGKSVMLNRALNVNTLDMTYADAQFLEQRMFTIDEIGRWFGIPPHLLGKTDAQSNWGTGIAEQNAGLHRYVLNKITRNLEAGISRLLGKKVKAEFDYKGFLAPTPEAEVRLILDQLNGGLLTPNEARALMNNPPVENGDTLRLPAGQTPPTEGADMNGTTQDSQTESGATG
jgi:HK97 family phage portal protein